MRRWLERQHYEERWRGCYATVKKHSSTCTTYMGCSQRWGSWVEIFCYTALVRTKGQITQRSRPVKPYFCVSLLRGYLASTRHGTVGYDGRTQMGLAVVMVHRLLWLPLPDGKYATSCPQDPEERQVARVTLHFGICPEMWRNVSCRSSDRSERDEGIDS